MKSKILLVTAAILFFTTTAAAADGLYMEPLKVSPEEPNTADTISIEATAYSPSTFEYLEFYVDGERKDRSLCSNSLTFPTLGVDLPFGCSSTFAFEPDTAGEYKLEVRAISPFGTSKRTKTVEVKQVTSDTLPPSVNAVDFSPAQPLPGEQVEINVLASDNSPVNLLGLESINVEADGEDLGVKPCEPFSGSCEKRFTFTPETSGSKTIETTVTSANSQTTSKEKTLYVREELSSSGVTGTVSNPVTVYVETTSGIDSSEYSCYWDDDDSITESDNRMDRDRDRFQDEEDFDEGEHQVYIGCFRDGSPTNTVSTSFTIEENDEPEADLEIDPENADLEEDITFDASESEDSDGDIEEYEWDFENDGDYDETTDEDSVEESFDESFDGRAKVRVTDDDGATDTATASYTVGDQECDIINNGLKLSKSEADTGDTVKTWIEVENNGASDQELTTSFQEDGEEFRSRTRTIDQDDSYNFTAEFEANKDAEIEAVITTSGGPCGEKEYTETTEIEVDVEGVNADFDYSPDNPEVDEEVEFDASDSTAENDIESFRWDFDDGNSRLGETTTHSFDEEGEYDVELEIEDEEGETDTRTRTIEVGETSEDTGTLEVEVTDEDGNELEDARIRARNGDTETKRTDEDGEAEFELEEDEYEIEASKDGYRTRTKTVVIEEGETENIEFELGRETSSTIKVHVTDGYTALEDVRIEANGETRYAASGRTEFEVGSGDYTVEVSKDGYRTVSKFISMESSETRTLNFELERTSREQQRSISLTVEPSKIKHGKSVKVKGYVDSGEGRSQVKISRAGNTLQSVSTQPDGYFQAFVYPKTLGNHNLKVQAGEASSSTPVNVQSTVAISGLEAPQEVFESSRFDICADIKSQASAKLRLYRNGELLDSRTSRGRTCFTTEADSSGEQKYKVTAVTPGDSDTVMRNIRVLELEQEVTSFPNNIAAVETESGIIKVDLYNTHEDQRRYDLEMNGIDDSWVSKTDEQVILGKGERESVYFYLNGREEGSYTPTIKVKSRGSTVYSKELQVEIGGTKTKPRKGFISRLQGLIPF